MPPQLQALFSSFHISYTKQVKVSVVKQCILSASIFRPQGYLFVQSLLNNTYFNAFSAFLGEPQHTSQIRINNILIRLSFLFSFYQQRMKNIGRVLQDFSKSQNKPVAELGSEPILTGVQILWFHTKTLFQNVSCLQQFSMLVISQTECS